MFCLQVLTSTAARQEAEQLKTQLSEINSSLASANEQLSKERTSGTLVAHEFQVAKPSRCCCMHSLIPTASLQWKVQVKV